MAAYRERRSREMAAYREGVQRCCLDIKQLDPNNARAVRLINCIQIEEMDV